MDNSYKDDTFKARLPPEVIMTIIESLIPENTSHSWPIFPASHVITKTLLSLTLVSKAAYPIASRLLWQNCLRIESTKTLHLFCDFISRKSIVTGRMPCEAYGSTRLFLAPFNCLPFRLPARNPVDGEAREEAINPSVYKDLHPWRDALKDKKAVEAVKKVLITLAPVLKSIIVDMPFSSLFFQSEYPLQKLLRKGLEAIVNVEDFVCITNQLHLPTKQDGSGSKVWTKWPKLQRLALHGVDIEPRFNLWKNIILCPQLEMAVFPRPEPSWNRLSEVNIKNDWSRAWTEATSQGQGAMSVKARTPYQGREITMAFCECPARRPVFDNFINSWERLDPENRICITTVVLHHQYDSSSSVNDDIVCSTWMRNCALEGSLWDNVHRSAVVNLGE
ncbi:hypothetical protein HYE68_002881 [Fusarium pseudograminearum]|nr:hypothetical protein HYE68_002881 [Fusarium pseudograminearum]